MTTDSNHTTKPSLGLNLFETISGVTTKYAIAQSAKEDKDRMWQLMLALDNFMRQVSPEWREAQNEIDALAEKGMTASRKRSRFWRPQP